MFQRGDRNWHEWSSMLAVSNAHVSRLRAEILHNKIHVFMCLVRCKHARLCSLSSSVQCCYEMQVSATGECLRSWLNVRLKEHPLRGSWHHMPPVYKRYADLHRWRKINLQIQWHFPPSIISGSLNTYACWNFSGLIYIFIKHHRALNCTTELARNKWRVFLGCWDFTAGWQGVTWKTREQY